MSSSYCPTMPGPGRLCSVMLALLVVVSLGSFVHTYKLNVPKVLLPFHSSKLISFTLEAKSESEPSNDEICFDWSSSRSDVVSITPIYTDSRSKCSNKAVVSAVSKHPQRLTSIIFAHETKTDKLIRCDVIVDQINKIRIKHTTTHLYLEDSPECFTAEALDDEGNTFSSIDGLAFEWSILNDDDEATSSDEPLALDSRNVLKISKFIESEYEVSESIRQLESVGLTGHKILIEGLKTGQANVQAKLVDPFYKATVLKSPVVRLLVVANLLLEPSYPVYLVPGAEIKYTVSLIKQHSVERINLPGSQYYFESRNSSIADLVKGEKTQSVVAAKHLGTTDVVLIDRNMKEEMLLHTRKSTGNSLTDQLIVPPPSATIHVVPPDHLVFSIKNWRSWILEVGRRYEIVVQVVSNQHMQIYVSDNLVIESQFDTAKFDVNYQSANGSYNYVAAREKGITVARASLKGTRALLTGKIAEFEWVARGEQEIELLDPIDVTPKILIFALRTSLGINNNNKDQVLSSAYEYRLAASGGSGAFYWQSKNTTIASVSAQGLVRTTATKLGQTVVAVTDVRNTDIQAKSIVYVLEPIDLAIQACPVETQVGTKLYLNIQMNAYVPTNDANDQLSASSHTIMPITDCSRLPFDVSILDESVFKLVSIQSPVNSAGRNSPVDGACAVVVLDSLRPGRTSIKISYSPPIDSSAHLVSNDMQIGSYSMLKSHKTQITLAKDSSLVINLYDGPLFSSTSSSSSTGSHHHHQSSDVVSSSAASCIHGNYQSEVSWSDSELLQVDPLVNDNHAQPNRYSYLVKCLKKKNSKEDGSSGEVTVKFSLAHKKSALNKCPLAFDYKLKVRCVEPASLELGQLFVNNEENTGNVLSTMKWKCPIKVSSQLATAHTDRPLYVQLTARDSLGNVFDNFTSLKTEWVVSDRALLEKSRESNIESLEVAALDDATLVLLDQHEDLPNSNRLYFQRFETRQVLGDTKVSVKMYLEEEKHQQQARLISSTLNIHFVSDVRIDPTTLTIFNHPSNIIPLGLSRGSGHYHAEIETVHQPSSSGTIGTIDLASTSAGGSSAATGGSSTNGVLKINQITESNVIVSPSANNGLTYLHVYDYCVPPATPSSTQQLDELSVSKLPPSIHHNRVMIWPAYATAKIQVAGINSILVNYEDDKVQVKNGLRIFVQISDATGNLIRTKYFPLMNLRAKLANVEASSVAGGTASAGAGASSAVAGATASSSQSGKHGGGGSGSTSLASVELDVVSRADSDEYTAVYVLNAKKIGIVSVQFEALSDGGAQNAQVAGGDAVAAKKLGDSLIQSGVKEIQIFSPLRVEPKYIELIRGAQYQVVISGGPVSLDAVISYETVVIENKAAQKGSTSEKKIIEIDATKGVIDALELGKVRVVVKSMGYACQPFSPKAATQSPPPPSRCTAESKIARVYSEDSLIVNVVELRSVQIHTPLRSIKRGNEMPVYLMANEMSLSALNFASSPSLKYQWRVNDHQIVGLYHPLIEETPSATTPTGHATSTGTVASNEEDEAASGVNLFERAFSLRLLAKQAGSVKISVRVEFLNAKNQLTSLTDSIDIMVFDEAQFTHFTPAYFLFKNPHIAKPTTNSAKFSNQHQLLMSPGTQLQVRTNFDNLASKITYELKFYQQQPAIGLSDQSSSSSSSSSSSTTGSSLCSNTTIRVSTEGTLTASAIKQSQLKHFQECTATLMVTILMASSSGVDGGGKSSINKPLVPPEQQTLVYTIRVKPVVYAMLKINKNSIAKLTETVKFKLNRQSLIKNRLVLSSNGVQMKWHVCYYDNLGDMFDVVNTNNHYTVNRNDLVDFSNINSNLFEPNAESYRQQEKRKQQVDAGTTGAGSGDSSFETATAAAAREAATKALASIVANAVENSFTLRTIDRGVFVMELAPVASSRSELSPDYIGLQIGGGGGEFDSAGGEFNSIGGRSRIDLHVGDLICLSRQSEQQESSLIDDDLDGSGSKRDNLESDGQWISQSSQTVKLVPSLTSPIQIGVCVSPGTSTLKKSMPPPHDSLLGLLEISVKPVDRVQFLSRSENFLSNARSSEASNRVQFRVQSNSQGGSMLTLGGTGQNCSTDFEQLMSTRSRSEQEQLNPFRCRARFYNDHGGHLVYLDRLVNTLVSYEADHWTCELKFAPESESLVYNLIENHIDRPASGFRSNQESDDSSRENEPVQIRIQIDSKVSENILDNELPNSPRSLSLPFVPAFYTPTKHIELSVVGNPRIRRTTVGSQSSVDSTSGLYDSFQLVVRATHSVRSHLIVTSNCPTLIKIKQHESSPLSTRSFGAATASSSPSSPAGDSLGVLSIVYDISPSDEIYDLNSFTAVLQQAKGEVYVQVTCSSTQQIERIPIRFVFGGLTAADAARYHEMRTRMSGRNDYSFWCNPLGYIIDASSNSFMSFLIILVITLITILAIMRLMPQSSITASQQMAMNAQAAAAAVAYQQHQSQLQRGSPKDYSSFNPYRYFSSSLDQVPTSDLNRSLSGHSPQSHRRMTPINQSESYYGTPNAGMRSAIFSGSSPSKPPIERDSIRLFSTDANVMLRSPRQQQDPASLSFRNSSRHYNDNSYSDNE